MVNNNAQPDKVVTAAANLRHYLYGKDQDKEQAKRFLRDLWGEVVEKGSERFLTQLHVDRCSEGGFAVHFPPEGPPWLNFFIKKAPSHQWAEQAYRFSERYMEGKERHEKYRMPTSHKPFYYDDFILCLTNFVLGTDLDRFLLGLPKGDKYVPYVEAIAEKSLDDLIFWQSDSKDEEVMGLPRPAKSDIVNDISTKTWLAVDHAREYGLVDIKDEELRLLQSALDIFDELILNEATIVPIADYCPKNLGIRKHFLNNGDILNPSTEDIIAEISTKSRPDAEKIAERLYHWDPAAKWGHFLEDFFAFYDSYEFGLFMDKKGVTSLDDRYKTFLILKYERDDVFKAWVDSLRLGSWNFRDKLADKLIVDRYLKQAYRAMRKSDLTGTRYAFMNETVTKFRNEKLYEATKSLLPKQISYYGIRAVEAIKSLLESFGNDAREELSEFEKLREDNKRAIDYFNKKMEIREDGVIINSLYLLYITNRIKDRKIDYEALKEISTTSDFAKPSSHR